MIGDWKVQSVPPIVWSVPLMVWSGIEIVLCINKEGLCRAAYSYFCLLYNSNAEKCRHSAEPFEQTSTIHDSSLAIHMQSYPCGCHILKQEELPTQTGVITPMLTWCYTPSYRDGIPCYAYVCPWKVRLWDFEQSDSHLIQSFQRKLYFESALCASRDPLVTKESYWAKTVDVAVLKSLPNYPNSEINQQG